MAKEVSLFHTKTPEQVLKELKTKPDGLTKEKVAAGKLKYGLNVIPEKKKISIFWVFLRQFRSLMIYILVIAAIMSLFLHRQIDAYIIIFVIFINAGIGFFQEYKAEKAIKALKKMIVPTAKVYRDGELIKIPARNLVPGDVILVEEGDRIPADSRLIEIKNFRTVEASLTGESLPVDKNLKVFAEKTPFADQKNMVWLGTFVAAGRAKAVVVRTGEKTIIGKLAKSIETIKPRKTHFQEKTDVLAKYMAVIAAIGAGITFVVGYFIRDFAFPDIFLFTMASLVSGIPEGLPAVLAIVLAIGAFRMARKKAIIRERYATETLGVVDTIVSDKTGTITSNSMAVREVVLPGQGKISVSGDGWLPMGEFKQNNKLISPLENKHFAKFLKIISLCNNSRLLKKINHKEEYEILGDPTEAALLVLAEKAGLKKAILLEKNKRIDDIPFNPSLKYHASLSVLTEENSKKQICVVGAPEAVLRHSSFILKNSRKTKLTKQDIATLTKEIDLLTNKAMRVLAGAYREAPMGLKEVNEEDASDLIFTGLVGMLDPPREGVKEAIAKTKRAGIRVIMATGDHKNTAVAIAKEIGLIDGNDKKYPKVLTEPELEEMSQNEFQNAVRNVNVFARLTPGTKLKIAKEIQRQGHIIAMTGDGVNDAPALKQADVGVSMGVIGTDVARESSSMIMADDNFTSIVNAIEEGRTVFVNTRQTSFFLVNTGIAENTAIVATIAIGMPLPLLPTQILWLNLVTDGVTDVALATEKSHEEVLDEKPRNKNENILTKETIPFLLIITGIMVVLTLLTFNYYLPSGLEKARTAAFTALTFTQLFNMYNMRNLKKSVFEIGMFSNKFVNWAFVVSIGLFLLAVFLPFLQGLFNFASLGWRELAVLFVLSSSVFWVGESYKVIKKRKKVGK